MESTPAENATSENHLTANGPLPEFVDWILGALIAISGLILIVGGAALVFVVDRTVLAEGIESGTVTVTLVSTELTEAEMLELTAAVASWTGTALLLTGSVMILFAIGYVIRRHRVHGRAQTGEPVSSYGAFAVLGAVVTGIVSFIPFAPGIGGAVAGYLERGQSERVVSVGALAGLLALLPMLAVLLFVLGGLVAGMLAIGESGMAIFLGAVMLFAMMLVATIGAGLGALGGYVGGRLAESRTDAS